MLSSTRKLLLVSNLVAVIVGGWILGAKGFVFPGLADRLSGVGSLRDAKSEVDEALERYRSREADYLRAIEIHREREAALRAEVDGLTTELGSAAEEIGLLAEEARRARDAAAAALEGVGSIGLEVTGAADSVERQGDLIQQLRDELANVLRSE